jgi:hypothetical protein
VEECLNSRQARWSGAGYNAELKKMGVWLKEGRPMFVAQHMLLAEHIMILVHIYSRSFPHTFIIYNVRKNFKRIS